MGKYDFELDMDSENSLSIMINMIENNSTVLEFGSANGRMTKYLKEKLNCTVDIVEIDGTAGKEAAQYSRDALLGSEEGDIENYIWCEKLQGRKYDYIVFADILEHLRNPEEVLKRARGLLAGHGYVLLSVPNIAHNAILLNLFDNDFPYKEIGLLDNTHIHFFAYKSLKKMIQDCGYCSVEEKATYCKAENTEFHSTYESISLPAKKELRAKEYGNAYQFVFKIADKVNETDAKDMEVACDDFCEEYLFACYYKTEEIKEYAEEYCKKSYFKPDKHNRFTVDFSDCKRITELRIDPLDCNCIIQNFCVRECGTAHRLEVLSSNGLYDENEYIFNTTDPMFFVEVPEAGIEKIEVSFDVVEYENNIIEQLYQGGEKRKELVAEKEELAAEKEELIAKKEELIAEKEELATEKEELEKHLNNIESELAHYKTHYFAAINQREDLKIQLSEMNQKYNAVISSTCWRITRPLRFVFARIKKICRSNRFLYLVAKGIKSLLTEGFRATWNKVRFTIARANANGNYYSRTILKKGEREFQENKKFDRDILFSIIVPLYNTPEVFLKEMIESVQDQTYAKWELCLADGSDDKHSDVEKIYRQYIRKDKRIKYKKLDNNLGISENTNAAIEMATGDYIGLFDHDDLLHPSVLYEYMNVICEKNADFIYCDEDKFETIDGKYFEPNFKPDFSIDYLRSNNYICHFVVFKKSLLGRIGLFRKQFDGSQDHDMILRMTEIAENIVHVPKVLYHWRCSSASVAANPNAKTYTAEAGIHAINEHLVRCGLKGRAESSTIHPNVYRVRYDITGNPMVSIIIPNKDHKEDLSRCVESIISKSTYPNYEIIIVENNSIEWQTFEYYKQLEEKPNVRIITYETKGEFNYSAINNYGVKFAKGEHILLLNNDIEIIADNWLEEMLMFSQREDVGAVGAKLYYPNETIQHAGVILGIGGIAGHSHKYFPRNAYGYMSRLFIQQDLSAVTAACLMMKKNVFEDVNGLDEEKFKVAFNDVDLCMKIRDKGYLIAWTPYAEAYHYESISRGLEDTPEKQERFQGEVLAFKEKWGAVLQQGDPYYNPNLTLDREDFSFGK